MHFLSVLIIYSHILCQEQQILGRMKNLTYSILSLKISFQNPFQSKQLLIYSNDLRLINAA